MKGLKMTEPKITKKDLSSYCRKYGFRKKDVDIIWNIFNKNAGKFDKKRKCYEFKDVNGTKVKIECQNFPQNSNVTWVGIQGLNMQ